MTSRDFAYWLQGYLELSESGKKSPLSAEQVETVARHLALVFKHEIDPAMGGKSAQQELSKIHGGPWLTPNHDPPLMRC